MTLHYTNSLSVQFNKTVTMEATADDAVMIITSDNCDNL